MTLPGGNVINFQKPADEETNCRLERDTQPVEFGKYVENVYCPLGSIPPSGTYKYKVRGDAENWIVEVHMDGVLVSAESGTGESAELVVEMP